MKVSIIMPVHNRAANTEKLLEELMMQKMKHPQTEIIVVENGSKEDMSFLNKYDIILKHCEPNVSLARNIALDIATGDYIAFIDNDDWIPFYYLDIIYDRIKTKKDWYIWQWYSDQTFADMKNLDIKHPLKEQRALWGYLWSRKMFDGVRFDLDDINGDGKVFDIITDETEGEFIQTPMYYYWFNGNEESISHRKNK